MGNKRFICIIDQQGGKGQNKWSYEQVSPVLTKGRSSIADIHSIVQVKKENK